MFCKVGVVTNTTSVFSPGGPLTNETNTNSVFCPGPQSIVTDTASVFYPVSRSIMTNTISGFLSRGLEYCDGEMLRGFMSWNFVQHCRQVARVATSHHKRIFRDIRKRKNCSFTITLSMHFIKKLSWTAEVTSLVWPLVRITHVEVF